MKTLAVIVALSISTLPLGSIALAETRPRYAGKIEGALLGAPHVLDPVSAQSHAELTVVGMMFDTLYRIELATGAIEPRIAAGPPQVLPSKAVRIPLRKGVKFHDGSTLSAADVAASLDRARVGGGRWALSAIAKVAVDGDGIQLTLKVPVDVAAILSLAPAAITKDGKAPNGKPIGTGAFELETIDRANRKITLKAFEDHFAGRTYLDRVVLRWYDKPDNEPKQFEIDALQLSARRPALFAGGQPKYKAGAVDGPKSLLVYIGFGRKHRDVLGDVGFRRALDLALERNAIASVNNGEPVLAAGEPLPVEAGAPPPTDAVRFGDAAAAKTALADAATRVAALRTPAQLTLEIAYEDARPDDREIAERVRKALGKLGVGATLLPLSAGDLQTRIAAGSTDLYIGQLALPLDKRLGSAWLAAAFSLNGDDNKAALAHAQPLDDARKAVAKHVPIVPLMFRGIRMWHRSDLHGLTFDAMGRPCLEDVFVFGQPVRSGP